jgi:hypothetical protein
VRLSTLWLETFIACIWRYIALGIAYGDAWVREFVPAAERAGIKITAREHYVRTDRLRHRQLSVPVRGLTLIKITARRRLRGR